MKDAAPLLILVAFLLFVAAMAAISKGRR